MKAWVIDRTEGRGVLRFADLPDPVPGQGDLLLKMRAAGLNRADLGRNAGHYERIATRPAHPIAGLEAAGEVIGMGHAVKGWAIGERVMGMLSGGHAEQVLIDHRLAVRVPPGLSWAQAAALPVALFTAHDALVGNARLTKGEVVFIQAAASGVGIACAQIARAMGAALVAGTASAPKLARLADYGLTHGIDYASDNVVEAVMHASAGRGADVIVDMVGAKAIADHMAMAALRARWIQVGRMGGIAGSIDLDVLAKKRISLMGVTFRTRDIDEFGDVVRAAWRDFGASVAAGTFAMPVEKVFALAEADKAQAAMRENRHFGKFVVET